MQWLSWVAQNIQRHNQDVFLIENMQPSWLTDRRHRWAYFLASRLIGGLIVGFDSGLSAGLGIDLIVLAMKGLRGGLLFIQQVLFGFLQLSSVRLAIGLVSGLFGGLSVGLIDLIRNKSEGN